ncbi:hypothetical protein CDL12_20032 [Handroanthus impetiginosus]|uniref:Retrotransposon gag domain-containing protein n=1 Tax=Handroanthus impetiginosus TaxID=429701 RepID=A0A2G9GQV2_9LAMI|nr:hypothetical protein CDL12_20032 [Handroanthus impetiginosus]
MTFRQGVSETIYEAWSRFKKILRNCPNHDIPWHIQVHTFYHGLTDGGKDKLDHLSGDSFLSETIVECHNLLNNLVANHYEKKLERATLSKAIGVIEVDQVITLNAKIDSLMQSMKNFGVNQVQHIPVTCDECGEGHPSYQCPHNVESIQFGLLTSNTEPNPRQYGKAQCQAVTLRNSREFQEVVKEPTKAKGNKVISEENEKEVEAPLEISVKFAVAEIPYISIKFIVAEIPYISNKAMVAEIPCSSVKFFVAKIPCISIKFVVAEISYVSIKFFVAEILYISIKFVVTEISCISNKFIVAEAQESHVNWKKMSHVHNTCAV